MRVEIFSLKKIEFQGQAQGLNVKTTSGEITLLDHHVPLITLLARGPATLILPHGERRTIPIAGGFLEMGPENSLTALVD